MTSFDIKQWERLSPLSEVQHRCLAKLSEFSVHATPAKFATERDDGAETKADADNELGDENIQNMQQFYNWFARLEDQTKAEEEETYMYLPTFFLAVVFFSVFNAILMFCFPRGLLSSNGKQIIHTKSGGV